MGMFAFDFGWSISGTLKQRTGFSFIIRYSTRILDPLKRIDQRWGRGS